MMQTLIEKMSPSQAALVAERDNEGKDLYMKGIFIQGEQQNHNGRVYPLNEINNAVKTLQEKIEQNGQTYEVDRFKLKSKDMSLPKDKRLDFDIWFDKKSSMIVRVSYSRMGNWEYRLKNFE